MFRVLGSIPRTHFHVACSGGPDSMVLVDYLLRWPKNDFDILYYNHGSTYCDEAEAFVKEFCKKRNLTLHVDKIPTLDKGKRSQEEFWRFHRYNFLSKFKDEPILMAHHLNDVIETWIMKCRLIPYHNKSYNIYRPFLCVPKKEINDWISRYNITHVIDGSNFNTAMIRNYIRHKMMNDIYHVNPGIEKYMIRMITEEYQKGFSKDV